MANFPLSDSWRQSIRAASSFLVEIKTSIVEQAFPVNRDQLQAAMIPEKWRGTLLAMQKDGCEGVQTTNDVSVIVAGEGIPRAAGVYLTNISPRVYFWTGGQNHGSYELERAVHHFDPLKYKGKYLFDLTALDGATRVKLVRWINDAVNEHRHAQLTRQTVSEFIGMCASLGCAIANWPAMNTVFAFMDSRHNYPGETEWKVRIAQLPDTKNRWKFTGGGEAWLRKNERIILAAEQMLLSASMLKGPPKAGGVNATVKGWQRINGEKI